MVLVKVTQHRTKAINCFFDKLGDNIMKKLALSEIWIYPIKSLGGIRLESSRVLPKGLEYDRRWMLVDDNGVFMTQRLFPQMALCNVAMHKTHFRISYNEHSINIPLQSDEGQQKNVQVWDDHVSVLEPSADYNQWFSDMLGLKCRLVYFPETSVRQVDPRYRIREVDETSLSDGYPFLLIGQSSLDDLNTRLALPIPMNRFRPNFVFTGGQPYEEDTWRNFNIGQSRFVAVKPCARCIMTTIDQNTATKSAEPLKTLSTYRKKENKILFGQNVIGLDHTSISVGDEITLN